MSEPRKKISEKVTAQLLADIGNTCPLCPYLNQDTITFDRHHIDENRNNNDPSNLLMVCPQCHRKIHNGYISKEAVKKAKADSLLGLPKVEIASVKLVTSQCNWYVHAANPFAFYEDTSAKHPYPVLDFIVINQARQTIVFTGIEVWVKSLSEGITGIPPKPRVLKSIARYRIPIKNTNGNNAFSLNNEIEIPASTSVKFTVELALVTSNEKRPLDGRRILDFAFKFNKAFLIRAPRLFFNCKNEGI